MPQFRSGFESGVTIDPASGHGSNYQLLRGADAAGGRFPIRLWGSPEASSGVLAIIGDATPEPVDKYIVNTLVDVDGPRGRPSRALSMRIDRASPKTCCTQDSFQVVNREEPVFYLRYWARLDDGVLQRARNFGYRNFWRMLWEMKAEPDDYRMRLQLQLDERGKLYWFIQADRLVNADPVWIHENREIPVEPGRWFAVEICMDRPGGAFWAAVDGKLVGRQQGDLYGRRRLRTTSVKHAILYGEPAEGRQWIDDLEIWSAPPCGRPPCGGS